MAHDNVIIDFGAGQAGPSTHHSGACFRVELNADNHDAIVGHFKKCGFDVYKGLKEINGYVYVFSDGGAIYDQYGLQDIPLLSPGFFLSHTLVQSRDAHDNDIILLVK